METVLWVHPLLFHFLLSSLLPCVGSVALCLWGGHRQKGGLTPVALESVACDGRGFSGRFSWPGGCVDSCMSPQISTKVQSPFTNQIVLAEYSGYHPAVLHDPSGIRFNFFHILPNSDNKLTPVRA